ncbi:citrate-binding protein-like [Prosopis cineraria]|uniref:citrate-binding protein-like n=1 Tax=Prosopis cineraria TaxID=364024 RepID=UPI00240FFAC6|nr:citrate-binding protein-like [Prosopis cineraria]
MKSILSFLLVSVFVLVCVTVNGGDPTDGFTPVPLTDANFVIQKPYNIPLDQRYSFRDGVHRLWVYANDKPHAPNSHTRPRTEIRIQGYDYHSGVWQFEGYGYVPRGTSGATVAQIRGAPKGKGATTLMLKIDHGNLWYYNGVLVAENMYDKWFRLNIIHDVDGGTVTVFIDGQNKFHGKDRGPADDFYFKCGVYASSGDLSYYMESRWRDIKIYKK